MLQVLVSPQAHVEVAHACREMFERHLVNHICRERIARRGRGIAPLRRDTSEEAFREIIKDGDQPRILV